MVHLLFVRRTQVLVILLVAFATSMPVSAATFADRVSDEESCYSGNYANAERFVESMREKMPNFKESVVPTLKQSYARLKRTADCRMFSYEVDGLRVRGFLAAPPEAGNKKLPVVIFNRSGNADTGEIPFRYIIGKLFPLVDAGFVVIGSQYRGASRNGKPNPDRLKDEFGGADVNDILALLPIIESIPYADAGHIGIWGESRGGMMAFLAARRAEPGTFSALVAEATPTDQAAELELRPGMETVFETWVPDFEDNREERLAERSALYWADELPEDLPALILHGTDDQRVSANSALRMALRLQELERPYRLVMYEGGGHSLRGDHGLQVRREVIDWFSEKLCESAESGDRRKQGERERAPCPRI